MGVETAAAGLGAAGAIGGGISGGKGTPDQVAQNQSTQTGTTDSTGGSQTAGSTTSKTTFDPVSQQQQQLQQASLNQYLQQLQGIDSQVGAANNLDPLRSAAIDQSTGVLNGQAFGLTQDEQSRIQGLRDAQVQQGETDISRFLGKQQGNLAQSAGIRGLRGQAYAQIQGDALRGANEQFASVVNNANTAANQNALAIPQQRIAAQGQYAQAGLTLADQLRQQAIQNRQLAQNPALLQQYQSERLAGGTNTSQNNSSTAFRQQGTNNSTTNGTTTTPGQEGGFANAIGGAIGGAGQGLGAGMGLAKVLDPKAYSSEGKK